MSWLAIHSDTIISAIGAIVVGGLVFLGTRLSGKLSAKAQAVQADATAYATARQIWGDLIDDLKSKVSDQSKELSSMRRRFDEEVQGLRTRLEDLETKRAGDRKAIHLLTEYAKALLRVLKINGIDPPAPPEGLAMDAD